MFNATAMLDLLNAQPFAPFRFHLSDGGTVDVPSREMVLPGRTFAVVGILEPERSDRLASRWTTVWYMHVTRVEGKMAVREQAMKSLASASGEGDPSTCTRYVRGCLNFGSRSRCLSRPSFVSRMSPSLSASSRPAG